MPHRFRTALTITALTLVCLGPDVAAAKPPAPADERAAAYHEVHAEEVSTGRLRVFRSSTKFKNHAAASAWVGRCRKQFETSDRRFRSSNNTNRQGDTDNCTW